MKTLAHYAAPDQENHDSLISHLMQELDDCDYVEQRDSPTDLWGTTYDGRHISLVLSIAG